MNNISIKEIKHQFFTYRNGIIADTMHQAGDRHKTIFGLGLPQIKSIAQNINKNKDLATALWENDTCRESQILACYLYPVNDFTLENANKWINEIPNIEIADIFCHALLRYTSFAEMIFYDLIVNQNQIKKYTALRLIKNLIAIRAKFDKNKVTNSISNLDRNLPSNYLILIQSIKEDLEFYPG